MDPERRFCLSLLTASARGYLQLSGADGLHPRFHFDRFGFARRLAQKGRILFEEHRYRRVVNPQLLLPYGEGAAKQGLSLCMLPLGKRELGQPT